MRPDNQPIDLKQHPLVDPAVTENTISSMGDLHGNALLMLYFLIRKGIITLEKQSDYNDFRKAYDAFLSISTEDFSTKEKFDWFVRDFQSDLSLHQDNNLTTQKRLENIYSVKSNKLAVIKAIDKMVGIIESATVNAGKITRFIGDMLADRGASDFVTLAILNKLKKGGVTSTILYSNHDNIFLYNFFLQENRNFDFKQMPIHPMQAFSLQTLCALVKNKIIDIKVVDQWVREAYLPALKLFDYSRNIDDPNNDKPITLYMHAYNDKASLKNLAKTLLTERNIIDNMFKSREEFKAAIDQINKAFEELIKQPIGDNEAKWNVINNYPNGFTWKRGSAPSQPIILDDQTIVTIVHGHDGEQNTKAGNLNGEVGKGYYDRMFENYPYNVLYILEVFKGSPCYPSNYKMVEVLLRPDPHMNMGIKSPAYSIAGSDSNPSTEQQQLRPGAAAVSSRDDAADDDSSSFENRTLQQQQSNHGENTPLLPMNSQSTAQEHRITSASFFFRNPVVKAAAIVNPLLGWLKAIIELNKM